MLGCNSMRKVAVIAVLMLICAGCAQASFSDCYRNCYSNCHVATKEVIACATKCTFKCIGKSTNSCNVRCAAERCSRFGNCKITSLPLLWALIFLSVSIYWLVCKHECLKYLLNALFVSYEKMTFYRYKIHLNSWVTI